MPRKKLLRYNYRMSACGRGEYTVGMAPLHPEVLHVGIDQKGDRISVGMQKAHAL
jgi:tRNA (guanine-N7-)-methyltransferase